MSADLPLARRDVIASRLALGQSVVASALAAEFAVSEDAVRRDLRALAALGLCRRVYGGALPPAGNRPLAARIEEGRERKSALAVLAAQTIRPGELVFLDAGSTNLAVVPHLPSGFDLAIATNSVDIAAAVLKRGDLRLIMIGGLIDPSVGGAIDAAAIEAVSRLNIDRCLIGACAASPDRGVSTVVFEDSIFKRAVLAASRTCLALLTNDKLVVPAPYRFASAAEVGIFICEQDADAGVVAALAAVGSAVRRAGPPA